MKKSRIYSVLSLALISGMLASCGQNELRYERPFSHIIEASALTAKPGEPEVKREEDGETILINDPSTDPAVIDVKSISVDRPLVSLYYSESKYDKFNQTIKLNAEYLPHTAKASAFKWSSDHPEIASVNELTGEVKALKAGVATITVTSENGLTASSHVVVNDANVGVSDVNGVVKEIKANQASIDIDKIYVKENYNQVKTAGDAVVERTAFCEQFWASKKEAYFRIIGDDQEVKCEGGSLVLGHNDYIFYTNAQYYTYVFSTRETGKTYMIVDQSNLVSTHSRYEAMLLVLQSFFVSGKAIIENQYRDIYGVSDLEYNTFKNAKYLGSFGSGSKQFAYDLVRDSGGTISFDEEEDWGIPAGTVVSIHDDIKYLWEENLMTTQDITEIISYELDGKHVDDAIGVQYYYEHENVELFMPKVSDYTLVPDIFSL